MMARKAGGFFRLWFFLLLAPSLVCQETVRGEVLRGEVAVDLEQVRGFAVEEMPPLELGEARSRALEEAAFYYGAMIYGWSFRYEVGERARKIEEDLVLSPLGSVLPEDSRLVLSDIQVRDFRLYLWSDYRPGEAQISRLAKWRAGTVRSAQGFGKSPLEDRQAALKDAARAALRAALRGGERNRPKEVRGSISLAAFPRYWLDSGQWMAAGRFFIKIEEIIPFSAY